MAARDMADIIIRSVYSYSKPTLRDEIKEYILGETTTPPTGKELSTIGSMFYRLQRTSEISCFDSQGNFLNNEEGEVLARFAELLYKNVPSKLQDVFLEFTGKYALYKYMKFSEAFVKEDFQKECSQLMNQWWRNTISVAGEYIRNYPQLVEEHINNYTGNAGLAMIAVVVLLIEKLKQNGENNEDIKKLERIQYSLMVRRFGVNKVNSRARTELKDDAVIEYLEKLEPIKIVLPSEQSYIYLLKYISNYGNYSELLRQGNRLAAMASPENFVYINGNDNLSFKKIEELELSDKYRVDYSLGRIITGYRIDEKRIYGEIERIVQKNPEYVKELAKEYISESSTYWFVLVSLLLKHNLLTDEEKEYWIRKTDEWLLRFAKESMSNPEIYEYTFPEADMQDFEFLKDENANLEGITIIERARFYSHRNRVCTMAIGAVVMMEYSTVAKNLAKLVSKVTGYYVNWLIQFIGTYKAVCPAKEENIYERLYEKHKFSMDYICKSYIRYWYRKNDGEQDRFAAFLKKYEDKAYEILNSKELETDEIKEYIEVLYEEDRGFNYVELTKAFERKNKSITNQVEEILKTKEAVVRPTIEELTKAKSKPIADTALRLIRVWDNDKIEEDMKNMTDIAEITAYISGLYTKNSEKNVPFAKEINYGKVRVKDSEKFVPEIVLKYYVSEYIMLKDLYVIKGCRKIEQIVNIYDLRNLLKNIFDMWIAEGSGNKYRNILLPLAITAGDSQLAMLKKQIDFWAENSKPGVATFAIQAMCMNGGKTALVTVDNMAMKHKNKKVKKAAKEAMDLAAEAMGITKEDLADIIVPDLGFGKDRCRVFNYGGERAFKAMLDDKLEITLYDNAGKQIKSLPKASAKYNDNEDMATEAKEELKNVKKQLKLVVDSQKLRIAKAVLTGRRWTVEKWKELFVENPIMNTFATKLIWEELDKKGNILKTFRYMEDGTFNTVDEDEYELENGTHITPLHPVDVDKEEVEAWIEQLEDYEIVQPVDQLNITAYTLSEDKENDREIKDFEKKKVYASTFKSAANKLGFNLEFAEYGEVSGCSFFDEANNIKIVVYCTSFYPGDYSSIVEVGEIEFLSENNRIVLKDVPKKILSLGYYAGNFITEKTIENRED